MAILMPNARFLHVPKTGGTWTNKALLRAVPRATWFQARDTDHTSPNETPERTWTIGFVRHPLGWWRSLWRFAMGPGRKYTETSVTLAECWSDDFAFFLSNVLERHPLECSLHADWFLGKDPQPDVLIGRQENLVDDLVAALRTAEQPFDENLLRATPRENESPPLPADCPADLELALLEVEANYCKRFGYGPTVSAASTASS